MNLDSLNKWLTLASNVGVIVGIVFLTVEIGQNQESIELQNSINLAEARDASADHHSGWRRFLLEDFELLSIWERGFAGETLTADEASRFGYLCQERIYGQLSLAVRMMALNLNEEVEGIILGLAGAVKESETYKACWNGSKQAFITRGYSDLISRIEQSIE